jgi:hypothetical protein
MKRLIESASYGNEDFEGHQNRERIESDELGRPRSDGDCSFVDDAWAEAVERVKQFDPDGSKTDALIRESAERC